VTDVMTLYYRKLAATVANDGEVATTKEEEMGLACVTITTTHTSKNSENGRTATVRPPPPWLYLAITWPKIIPQKMLSNRNTRHERARHLATRRGVARRIYHSMASLLHC